MQEEKKLYDRDIREPLFEFLEETYGKIRILEEKTMGKSRADVVMVLPDALCGIEIKSDADTYARLAGQVKDYDRYYDMNFLVAGTSHALHIREHVPEYWGLITVEMEEGRPDFYILRKPCRNPNVEWKRKLEILWRTELAAIQTTYEMPKYKEKSRHFVITKIVEWMSEGKISQEQLKEEISRLLMERDYTTIGAEIAEYRKGEIAKKLEQETDPARQIELYTQKSIARANLKKRSRRFRTKG